MKYTEDMLREAVASSDSLAGVLRHLGVRWSGGQQASIKRRITNYGIGTDHFVGQAHRRGCVDAKRLSAADILVRRTGNRRQKTTLLRRALREIGRPEICEGCGGHPEWRGRPLVLEVDHIDGDWLNDRAANLRYLCPNCHSQAVVSE